MPRLVSQLMSREAIVVIAAVLVVVAAAWALTRRGRRGRRDSFVDPTIDRTTVTQRKCGQKPGYLPENMSDGTVRCCAWLRNAEGGIDRHCLDEVLPSDTDTARSCAQDKNTAYNYNLERCVPCESIGTTMVDGKCQNPNGELILRYAGDSWAKRLAYKYMRPDVTTQAPAAVTTKPPRSAVRPTKPPAATTQPPRTRRGRRVRRGASVVGRGRP